MIECACECTDRLQKFQTKTTVNNNKSPSKHQHDQPNYKTIAMKNLPFAVVRDSDDE